MDLGKRVHRALVDAPFHAPVQMSHYDVSSGSLAAMRKTAYTYYTSGGTNGLTGDLKLAEYQVPANGGGWTDAEVYYYRYYTASGGWCCRSRMKPPRRRSTPCNGCSWSTARRWC
jgi:hypothetical protein